MGDPPPSACTCKGSLGGPLHYAHGLPLAPLSFYLGPRRAPIPGAGKISRGGLWFRVIFLWCPNQRIKALRSGVPSTPGPQGPLALLSQTH